MGLNTNEPETMVISKSKTRLYGGYRLMSSEVNTNIQVTWPINSIGCVAKVNGQLHDIAAVLLIDLYDR